MTDEEGLRAPETGPDDFPEAFESPIARAWGRGFLVRGFLIILVYESVVVWLAPDKWRMVFAPFCLVPVHGLAHWTNARRSRRRNT